MKRWVLGSLAVLIVLPLLFVGWAVSSHSGSQWLFTRSLPLLPEQLKITGISGRLLGPLQIQGLHYQTDSISLDIDSIALDWAPARIFSGTVHINELQLHNTRITLSGAANDTPATIPVIILPIAITLDSATADRIEVAKDGQPPLVVLTDTALQLSAERSAITIQSFTTTHDQQQLQISGLIQPRDNFPLELDIHYQQTLSDGRLVSSQGTVHGDLQTLILRQDLVEPLKARFTATLKDVLTDLHWQAQLETPTIKLAALDPSWPAIAGDLNVTTSGSLQDYKFQLTSHFSEPRIPTAELHLSGTGDLNSLLLNNLTLTLPAGQIQGKAKLQLGTDLQWQASLQGNAINPGIVWSDWPGQLAFAATATGQIDDDGINAQVDINQASGFLRGYPVELQANLTVHPSTLDITRLLLRSGNSQIQVNGHVGEQLALEWDIHSTDLKELHPVAQGQLNAHGQVGGMPTQLRIDFTAQGQHLSWPGYKLDNLAGSGTVDLFSWQTLQVELQAQGLMLNELRLENIHLFIDGSDQKHVLVLETGNTTFQTVLRLEGSYSNNNWDGQLLAANLSSPRFGEWLLESPAQLHLTATDLTSQPICWTSTDGSICLQLSRQLQHWVATLKADDVQLAPLSALLPDNLQLNGLLSAKASVDYQADTGTKAQARLTLSPGSLSYPLIEGERNTWNYERGSMDLQLDAAGLDMALAVSLNGDRWQLAATLPGLDPLSFNADSQTLRGSAHIDISDLGLIEAMTPEIQGLKGKLATDLKFSGTLAQPGINGQVRLDQSQFQIPRLGLKIEDLNLSITALNINDFDYQVSAKSNKGLLLIKGQTHLRSFSDWSSALTISGKNVEVAYIPEARVTASPELSVTVKPYEIHVDGSIHIPMAKLQPKDVSRATPISDDVTITNVADADISRKWLIYSNVRLTLGEQVTFFGFGFEGRFTGNLLLMDQPGQPTLATGELDIHDGRYRAYGQRLNIEQGRILFSGPVNNPGLNLRAARYIGDVTAGVKINGTLLSPQAELYSVPAMEQTDTLAYLVLGRPLAQASGNDGSMMAGAALALGLSGGDLLARKIGDRFGLDEMRIASSDTGEQAELIIGTYLNPRLYLTYGIGLIESANTVIIRYQVSRNWQFKAESGIEQGADMLYIIER